MKRLAFALLFLAFPAFAEEAPNYHAIDEMRDKAMTYVSVLEAQRDAALAQVLELTWEITKLKKAKACEAK